VREAGGGALRLHWSPRSPFVRKVMVAAYETGVVRRLDCTRTVVGFSLVAPQILADNPVNRIPTLVLPDGSSLYDSRVICEYFDELHDGPRLVPRRGPERWQALRWQALGDGVLENLLLLRLERGRPPEARNPALLGAIARKVASGLDTLEAAVPALDAASFAVGHITAGCVLAYLDFRFAQDPWRPPRPQLARWFAAVTERPSFAATAFIDEDTGIAAAAPTPAAG
jgi:glutathione S-transferase